ncbi:heparinase II/III domain-containing protein [Terasakiella sp.]|uniref:heparinase II/III domain-containing protein n=1 Tax=Terasakiella sp. TaxID=2034861 RepID=UPI003AA99260
MTNGAGKFLFVDAESLNVGLFEELALYSIDGTQKHSLPVPELLPCPDILAEVAECNPDGLVFSVGIGVVPWAILKIALKATLKGKPVWIYWGSEGTVQRVGLRQWNHLFAQRYASRFFSRWHLKEFGTEPEASLDETAQQALSVSQTFDQVFPNLQTIAFSNLPDNPSPETKVHGTGIYFRGDFWAPLVAGGSYGHTTYVAKELSEATEDFVCLMANPLTMIDELGIKQVKLDPPGEHGNDLNVLKGTDHYYEILKEKIQSLDKPPAYIYERLILGNYAAARISRDLGIPYILEYNGSEISMKRSFDTQGYDYEDTFMLTEEAAFRQAALIVVVSEAIRDMAIRRGVDPRKILVNPNGVDTDHYKQATVDEKKAIKTEMGWDENAPVIGFIGTFGGWHGIDVLAESLPRIAAEHPEARFLLIGDGGFKHLVETAVTENGLEDRVKLTGMVPQAEGCRLLKGCDIFISPHSAHMVDSRFFGSPTKLFEYMALGGAVIASDLEQIGDVMRPSLYSEDLASVTDVGDARGVLVEPADVNDFVFAVCGLLKRPELISKLGENSVKAVSEHYSWKRHVERIWQHLLHLYGGTKIPPGEIPAPEATMEKKDLGDETEMNDRQTKARQRELAWYSQQRKNRYQTKLPWLCEEFPLKELDGKEVLILASDNGYDAVTLAEHGAKVTMVDYCPVNLREAEAQFKILGLEGTFIPSALDDLPFTNDCFDIVICVSKLSLQKTPYDVVSEIGRVLKPGGRSYVGLLSQWSAKYWYSWFARRGLKKGRLSLWSMNEVLSRSVDITYFDKRELVSVWDKASAKRLFNGFTNLSFARRDIDDLDIPGRVKKWLPKAVAERFLGWKLIVTAKKPKQGFEKLRGVTKLGMPQYNFDDQLKITGQTVTAWVDNRRQTAFTYAGIAIKDLEALKRHCPDQVKSTLNEADRVLRHEFDLLGSGTFIPSNMSDNGSYDYKPINWHLDPVRNLTFPSNISHKQWNLFEMRPGNADVKYPWELGRLQHWPLLAQAYVLSGDFKYAREISDQLKDFMASNPIGIGVNWTCTMDVAIRAGNMAIAFDILRECNFPFEKTFWDEAYKTLFEHGDFIYRNLENHYEVTSNHFLSNVAGLYIMANAFSDLEAGQEWGKFCHDAYEKEIIAQVLPDGADYESSVPYHRLVTELFMSGYRMAQLRDEPLSEGYAKVLTKMLDFLSTLTRPDGRMPQIGDADDGRLHIFTDYGRWDRQDARHLYGPASVLLKNDTWQSYLKSEDEARWETFWWGLDTSTIKKTNTPERVAHFADAGLSLNYANNNWLLINNAIVGTKGFGNHKHNDLLSFELHLSGTPFVVDPGSYVYTSDFAARNHFRSTRSHATVMFDGVEQNEMRPDWIFRMFAEAEPHVEQQGQEGEYYVWCGWHDGYKRIGGPNHWRTFVHDTASGSLVILDRFIGGNFNEAEWNLPLAVGVDVSTNTSNSLSLQNNGIKCEFNVDQEVSLQIEEAGYSPSYGVKQPAKQIKFKLDGQIRKLSSWIKAGDISQDRIDNMMKVAEIHMNNHSSET